MRLRLDSSTKYEMVIFNCTKDISTNSFFEKEKKKKKKKSRGWYKYSHCNSVFSRGVASCMADATIRIMELAPAAGIRPTETRGYGVFG